MVFDAKELELNLTRRQRAAEVAALVYGFRDRKPNLRRITASLTGNGPTSDLDELQDLIEESHARVDPEVRRKQLEEKEQLRRFWEEGLKN